MTKTKRQLRAEAVERLTKLNEHGYWEFPVHVALCGRDVPDVDEERAIIADLLTDDCGPCYSCAKLAELRAENSQLRVKVDAQRDSNGTCPDAIGQPSDAQSKNGASLRELYGIWSDDCGHLADMSAKDAYCVRDGGEMSDVDSRDNGWYLRYDGYMTSKSNYLRISGFKAARALDNRQNLVFVKFMGGKEADCRVYAPKLDVCENLHDSSKETQKPRSREADSGNVSDSDGENLHVEQDSREKLEADAGELTADYASSGGVCDALYRGIIDLLDRQAAIAERETKERVNFSLITQTANALFPDYQERIADLQAKVDELTAQLEAAYAKNRSLKEHIAKMQEGRHGWHVKYPELEKKNAELEAERDELRAAYDEMTAIAAQLCRACGFSMVDASGEVVG